MCERIVVYYVVYVRAFLLVIFVAQSDFLNVSIAGCIAVCVIARARSGYNKIVLVFVFLVVYIVVGRRCTPLLALV